MLAARELSLRLYQGFHDWRVRLYNDLGRIELDYLRALHGDVRHLLEQIEHEIATRNANRN